MSPLLLPLVPLGAAGAVVVVRRRPRLAAAIAVGALVATTIVAFLAALAQPALTVAMSPAVELALRVEGFGRVMVVLVPLIATPVVAYAAATEDEGRARLLSLLLAFVGAMLLLVVAADFVTLLIGWELVGAISWALIGHAWQDGANVEAATRAFVTTRLGDLGLYVAAGATFAASGSFAFVGLAGAGSPWLGVVAAGVLLAAAAKSAQVPFSPWLFDAMVGPSPVSALLHSATLVAAGAYLLVRLAPVLAPVAWFGPAIALVGLVTALSGGLVATLQLHPKRLLAASTSAQYGLMFVAVGAGSVAAAGAHLVAHAAFKSLLFLAAGVATHATGATRLDRLRLGRALPLVGALSAVGVLALAGVPPFGAAWSKDEIVAGAGRSSPLLGLAVLVAGLLSALYAGRYHLLAFGRGRRADSVGAVGRRPGLVELAALGSLAAVTLGLSALWLPGVAGTVEEATRGSLVEAGPGELAVALVPLLLAAGLIAWLVRHDRLADLGLDSSTQTAAGDWLGLPTLTDRLVVAPTLRLSQALARADDRVIDAGVRRAVALAGLVSRLASGHLEFRIDALVSRIASVTLDSARASRVLDDSRVDRAVEASARSVGLAGRQSRRLQTGLAHHYYVIVAAGLALIAAILAAAR